MKPMTPADLQKAVKGFYDTHVQALNGMLDKVPDALKSELVKLKDTLNEQLSKLPPLEQVPAAQEAGWAIENLSNALVRMQEYASGLLSRLTDMSKELNSKVTALQGFETKIKDSELMEKGKVKELCDAARAEGAASVMPQVAAMRKSQVELAGLPMPGDDVLGLNAEDFDKRIKGAKEQVEALGKRGLKLGGRGAKLVTELAWLPGTEFNGRLEMYADLIGGENNPAHPLLGNPGEPADKKEAKRSRMLV